MRGAIGRKCASKSSKNKLLFISLSIPLHSRDEIDHEQAGPSCGPPNPPRSSFSLFPPTSGAMGVLASAWILLQQDWRSVEDNQESHFFATSTGGVSRIFQRQLVLPQGRELGPCYQSTQPRSFGVSEAGSEKDLANPCRAPVCELYTLYTPYVTSSPLSLCKEAP